MSVSKKHLTTLNVVAPDDGLFAQQVNYGLGTTIKSLADVTTRHFEDYNAKFNEDKIFDGFVSSQNGDNNVDVSAGNATVKGIWMKSTSTIGVTIPSGLSKTYFVFLQAYGDGGTDETRNPLNDTVEIGAIISTSFSGTFMHPIAKVTTDGAGIINSVTDYGALFSRRMDSIKPRDGSTITVFTGTFPDATQEVALFSGTSIQNRNDNGGYWGGATDDYRLYNDGNDNILDIINDNFQIDFAGTPKYTFTDSMLGLTGGLIVSGTTNLIGAVSVSGTLLVDDNIVVLGTLAVSGAMTFDDDVDVLGNFSVSGTTVLDETLNVLGAVTNQSTSNTIGASSFSGAMLIDDTLEVLGASSFSGASIIDDTLKVTGVFTASGTSTHQGHSTFDQNIILTGELQGASIISGTNIFGSQLSGTSIVTDGSLSVSGATVIDDTLHLTGIATFDSNITIGGTSLITGASNFIGASSFSGAMLVDDTFIALNVGRFESDMYVNGSAIFSGISIFRGATLVDAVLTVTGEIQASSIISGANIFGSQLSGTSLLISGGSIINNSLDVTGTLSGTVVSGTTITGATMSGAVLSGVSVKGTWNGTVLVDSKVSDSIGAGGQSLSNLQGIHLDGVGNAEYVSMGFVGYDNNDSRAEAEGSYAGAVNSNETATAYSLWTLVGIPFNKGSLSLRVSGFRITVFGNGSNYITMSSRTTTVSATGVTTVTDITGSDIGDTGLELNVSAFSAVDCALLSRFGLQFEETSNTTNIPRMITCEVLVYYA